MDFLVGLLWDFCFFGLRSSTRLSGLSLRPLPPHTEPDNLYVIRIWAPLDSNILVSNLQTLVRPGDKNLKTLSLESLSNFDSHCWEIMKLGARKSKSNPADKMFLDFFNLRPSSGLSQMFFFFVSDLWSRRRQNSKDRNLLMKESTVNHTSSSDVPSTHF